jgi:DNA-binding FrmR family transcriptional regulator
METQSDQVLKRLKTAQGHLGAVVRMTEEDTYCIDVLRQIQAVQAALDKAAALILEQHLNACVTAAIRGEDSSDRERVLAEILDIYQSGTGRR